MIKRAGYFRLCVEIRVLAHECEELAVEYHFDIGKTACARRTDLVRTAHISCARARQQELLVILGDNLEIGVKSERYGLLRRQVIGHGFEHALGVCLIGYRSRGRTGPDHQGQGRSGYASHSW